MSPPVFKKGWKSIPTAHILETGANMIIKQAHMTGQDGEELFAQQLAARHPLIIAIRTVLGGLLEGISEGSPGAFMAVMANER